MRDIIELTGRKKVNFTILPGLFVNKKAFDFAKALVFCEYESNPQSFSISKIPKNHELVLNKTIKTEDLINKVKVDFSVHKDDNDIKFYVKTEPKIPIEDNTLFLLRFLIDESNWAYLWQTKDNNFSIIKSIFHKNQRLSIDVLIYGKTIFCKMIKL